jgi:hypothetical protein
MYEKIIGNHVGIVVNDQDPEKRSRLQIFVPHVSNTLFSNWNANLKDISFKTFETPTFSPDIIQRLKDTLPWAEAAVPSFGGGTSGPVSNFFHRAANVSMQYLMAGSSWAGLAAEYASGALVDHSIGYDNPTSLNLNSQGDPLSNNLQSIAQNALENNIIASAAGENVSMDLNGSNNSIALEGGPLTRDIMIGGKVVSAGTAVGDPITSRKFSDGSYANGVTDIFIAVPNDQVGKPFAITNNATGKTIIAYGMDGGGVLNDGHIEISNAASVALGGSPFAINKNGLAVTQNTDSYDLKVAPITDGSLPYIKSGQISRDEYNQLIGNPLTIEQQNALVQMDDSPAMGSPFPSDTSGSNSRPIQRQGYVDAMHKALPTGANSAPGYFSKPAVGAKVWVFFHGGNPQTPVYFASVVEPNASVVAYQAN